MKDIFLVRSVCHETQRSNGFCKYFFCKIIQYYLSQPINLLISSLHFCMPACVLLYFFWKQYVDFHSLTILFIFHLQTQILGSVDRCPRDEIEWDERASFFNCTVLVLQILIATKSKITEPLNYMYHCVLTGDGKKLVQVCARSVNIHGTCNNVYYMYTTATL